MEGKGIIVVVSGFSGAGKGTLMKELVKRYPNYALSISATTREPREGEKEGREYFFKTVEEFEQMISEDALIEYARYVENYYGTPRGYVEEKLSEGKDVILEIEIQGALKIKEKFPDALLLFVMTPDAKTLKERLTHRGTESPEKIASRLSRAVEEAEGVEQYDYVVVNDDLEACVELTNQLIQSAHYRADRNLPFIEKMREELRGFKKGE